MNFNNLKDLLLKHADAKVKKEKNWHVKKPLTELLPILII